MRYPKHIRDAVDALIKNLEVYYPDIDKKTYPHGLEDNNTLRSRMEMGLYLELIYTGIIKGSPSD